MARFPLLYGSGRGARDSWERFTLFMDRFHVAGLKRVGVEAGCEAFTIAIAAGLFLLALAAPAFDLVSRRLPEEGGPRGHLPRPVRARRSAAAASATTTRWPFDELPPNLIHAVVATEDRRFFEHFGIDIIGTMRALSVDSRANGVVQGGSSLTQQLAKNLFLSNERTIGRKVNEAFLALWLEWHLSEAPDPRPLPRSRLSRRRHVRRAGGGAILLRQVGAATSRCPRRR